jgi:hypothetical protein
MEKQTKLGGKKRFKSHADRKSDVLLLELSLLGGE